MSSTFALKYPALASLCDLVCTLGTDALAQNETMTQKLASFVNVVSPAVVFLPQINLIGPELTAIKALPSDIELGVEYLLAEGFESAKAKQVMAALFPVAEDLAGMIPKVEALITAAK